jgi:hypothetical protein
MGFAFDSGSGVVDSDSISCGGFSLISTSEAELVADVAAGVGARLCPGTRLESECRLDQTSLMRLSSKSRQSGMMLSRLSDQTTNTRSSRCWARGFNVQRLDGITGKLKQQQHVQ